MVASTVRGIGFCATQGTTLRDARLRTLVDDRMRLTPDRGAMKKGRTRLVHPFFVTFKFNPRD